jgi:hypothetical protein
MGTSNLINQYLANLYNMYMRRQQIGQNQTQSFYGNQQGLQASPLLRGAMQGRPAQQMQQGQPPRSPYAAGPYSPYTTMLGQFQQR